MKELLKFLAAAIGGLLFIYGFPIILNGDFAMGSLFTIPGIAILLVLINAELDE